MAEKPEAIYMFGDSLSDLGAFYALSGQVLKVPLPPASAGYEGWFSNGLVQSGVTGDLLDVPTEVYAVGAARAVDTRTVEQYLVDNGFDTPEVMLPDPSQAALDTDINLGGQVGRFVASGPPAEGAAAGIWIGANDYNNLPSDATPELVKQTIEAVIGSILGAAGALAHAGVDRILLYNLPSPKLLPDVVPLPPGAEEIVDAHNATLLGGVALLASQGIEASIVDMHRIGDEILADFAHLRAEPGLSRNADAARPRQRSDLGPGAERLAHPGEPGAGGRRSVAGRLLRRAASGRPRMASSARSWRVPSG